VTPACARVRPSVRSTSEHALSRRGGTQAMVTLPGLRGMASVYANSAREAIT